jgi:hypothetical protein
MIKYLVEHVADFQSKDKNETLIWACEKGQFEIVKYFVENGANAEVNAVDENGKISIILPGRMCRCVQPFSISIQPVKSILSIAILLLLYCKYIDYFI